MEDLASLTDRPFGWETDYAILQDAGLEAVREHPAAYGEGVTLTLWRLLRSPAYMTPPSPSSTASETGRDAETIVVNGRVLPKPSDDESIPGSH